MNHAGRFRTGPGGEIGLVNQHTAYSLQGKVPNQAGTVDTAAQDKDLAGVFPLDVFPYRRSFLHKMVIVPFLSKADQGENSPRTAMAVHKTTIKDHARNKLPNLMVKCAADLVGFD
jgi:hypothetical protein